MFPNAAAANRNIFYDHSGRARSVGEVYGKLTKLFDTARAVAFAPLGGTTNVASADLPAAAPPLPPARTVASTPLIKSVPKAQVARLASADIPRPPAPIPRPALAKTPDTAGTTQAFAKASEQMPAPPVARASFESMFTDRVRQPLTQTVSTLWGPTPAGAPTPPSQTAQVFDLFTDPRPNTRKLSGNKV
jgi:hypothetical protein